ncbi:MAG TPA: molybdate ABC transporter substrate-binding protein [Rhodocyclaceae bacterium]|nr:molybdate ABC transporter substrate-binding protein [Rhodocyclaceae bacterium]
MQIIQLMLVLLTALLPIGAAASERLTIAAASDLRYALDEVVAAFRTEHPGHAVTVIYGSSGKMTTQIVNGAPYDVFFSADIAFPRRLWAEGHAATEPRPYATGRIVLWSTTVDASQLALADLADARFRRIAIAQPAHAPYGQRAQEALEAAGLWEAVRPRLVFAENVAHAAQMVQSGAADIGIIALSLALFPDLARHGHHLIDGTLHAPLTQAYVVTRRARDNAAAQAFAGYMQTEVARAVMARYGFVLPHAQ